MNLDYTKRWKYLKFFPDHPKPLLFGHRGCSKAAPENTLAAFEAVLVNRIPGVEIDIHMCGTGELVVIHDSHLKRITGIDSVVEHTSYKELKKLDAGSWFHEKYRGERIPLLEEVLELLGEKVYYDIEIKTVRNNYGPLEEKLIKLLNRRKLRDHVLISSFDPFSLREVIRQDPSLSTAHIYSGHKDLPLLLRSGAGRFICRPLALKPHRRKVGRTSIALKQRAEGYPLLTWTVDDPSEAEMLLSMGVDGIISNVPERMLSLLNRP